MSTPFQRAMHYLLETYPTNANFIYDLGGCIQCTPEEAAYIADLMKHPHMVSYQSILRRYYMKASMAYAHCLTPGSGTWSFPPRDETRIEYYPKYFAYNNLGIFGQPERKRSVMYYVARGALLYYFRRKWSMNSAFSRVIHDNIQPGFDVVDLAYQIAFTKMNAGAEVKRYQILLGGLNTDKYPHCNFFIHSIGFLQSIVALFPVRRRPIIAMQLASDDAQFIYDHINKPFMVEFLMGLTSVCFSGISYRHLVAKEQMATKTFMYLHQNMHDDKFKAMVRLLKPILPENGFPVDVNDTVYENIELLAKGKYKHIMMVPIVPRDADMDQAWIYHLILTINDGYYTVADIDPVSGNACIERGLKIIAHLPSEFINRLALCVGKPSTKTYEDFLDIYLWLAFH